MLIRQQMTRDRQPYLPLSVLKLVRIMLLNACCVPSALTGLAIGAHRKRPDPPGDTATGQSISKTLADRPIVVESGCRMSQRRDDFCS